MGDRIIDGMEQAVSVSFFGSSVMLPVAAYRLASASGSPVVCAFALRTGPKRGKLHLADVLYVPAGLGKAPRNYQPYAQRFAGALERFCREYPYQFFTFYDLWEQ
jgi:predicted LPLAT superfamily acyltransferase